MSVVSVNKDHWQARLQLEYQYCQQRTVLSKRSHQGPLLVQRPFYPEQGVCHTYIIHPPGGVVGGDQLEIDVAVKTGAHALITTPASGKFYNSQNECARMTQTLHVENDAMLEWLPQDNIFFEDSRSSIHTSISLSGNARFIGWEISCLGRPFSGRQFDRGYCDQKLVLQRNDLPVVIDHTRLQANHDVLRQKWGLATCTVNATLMATPVSKDLLEPLRREFENAVDYTLSVTILDGVLLCRFLGHQGETARKVFEKAWGLIRPHVGNLDACPPRIWKT